MSIKNEIIKRYELTCKYGIDERISFYRMIFDDDKVIDYLKKCIKKLEKQLKKYDS